mgnify:CR=1 FL=1
MEVLREYLLPELVQKVEEYLYGDILEEGEFFRAEDCLTYDPFPAEETPITKKLSDMSSLMGHLVKILQALEESTQETLS